MLEFEIVFVASVVLSIIIVVLTRIITNPEDIRKIKKEMKFYSDKVKEAQKSGDAAKVKQFTDGMLKASQKQLRHSIKPMFISIIIFMIAIWWLGGQFAELVIPIPFSMPFIGYELNWFWWYVLVTFAASMSLRKLLGVE